MQAVNWLQHNTAAMYIQAVYNGKHGSLGYRAGQAYLLIMEGMTISRTDGQGRCAYESIEAFMRNWTAVIGPLVPAQGVFQLTEFEVGYVKEQAKATIQAFMEFRRERASDRNQA